MEETPFTMASGFKVEKFGGDGTDDTEDYLKMFDRYVDISIVKPEQKVDLLCLHLEKRAMWFAENLNPPPADLTALKTALINKFKEEKRIKLDI